MKTVLILLVVFAGIQTIVRFWPLPSSLWHDIYMAADARDVVVLGGYYLQSNDAHFGQVTAALKSTSGLRVIKEGPPLLAVYRSWFWGFPDMIELWEDEGTLHIRGHSVLGGWDLGSNKKRIIKWLNP